ncbi:MAG: NUDIX hydrolase [Fretibacterium sp.]|nr:NUDIX hydrolase [Fretibacterium sp.]
MAEERKNHERQSITRRLYEGKILNLRVDDVVMPSGRTAKREVVEHKHAVGMLAVTDRDSVLLVRQYRYAVDEEMVEICAGMIEEGEDPRETAVREMQEELGVRPETLTRIGGFYATPGFCTEFMTLFLAENLSSSSLPQDDDEDVSTVEVPLADVPRLFAEGRIRDSKTFAALSWLMAWKGMKP